jgi:hypothetical protein
MKLKMTTLAALTALALFGSGVNLQPVPTIDTPISSVPAANGEGPGSDYQIRIYTLYLSNSSGAPINCTLKDFSRNSENGPCTVFGPYTLAAAGSPASIVFWDFHGMPVTVGVQWSCSASGASGYLTFLY